jgi:hypothetical protein
MTTGRRVLIAVVAGTVGTTTVRWRIDRRRQLALMPVTVTGAAGLTMRRSRQLGRLRGQAAWPREAVDQVTRGNSEGL